ncbi:MAG TPA: molybdopterin-dependent oxidoreductase [Rhizomicrobium sp.]
MRTLFTSLLFSLLLVAPAAAQEAASGVPSTSVKLDGTVKTPATYSMADLAALPAAGITLTIQGHDAASGNWKGVPLMALIEKAGTVEDKGHGAYLQHVIIARGTDGYGVAIAIGEIEPKFEGKQVIVAYQKDGAALPSLRLIIPGDAHAGRDVRDLAELTVK